MGHLIGAQPCHERIAHPCGEHVRFLIGAAERHAQVIERQGRPQQRPTLTLGRRVQIRVVGVVIHDGERGCAQQGKAFWPQNLARIHEGNVKDPRADAFGEGARDPRIDPCPAGAGQPEPPMARQGVIGVHAMDVMPQPLQRCRPMPAGPIGAADVKDR